ncbi:MAG TPA: hypothetical protein VHT50_10575 [Mycobacterium sp.]|nr:hypothetical protein [Mycobacterium sp.]
MARSLAGDYRRGSTLRSGGGVAAVNVRRVNVAEADAEGDAVDA